MQSKYFQYVATYTLSLGAFLTVMIMTSYAPQPNNGAATKQEVRPFKIPSNIDFCGEYVPLDNIDVRERLDREIQSNAFMHGSMSQIFKLSRRIFPIVEPILAQNGIPDDFKYLAVAESALREAVSPAGARGIWQFMPGTAKEHGLQVNAEIDERMHLEKVTLAACRYLQTAYARYGNWISAAASYNCGMGKVSNELSAQRGRNYFDLQLAEETNRYVFRILAFKEIMSNPTNYGFYIEEDDYYQALNFELVAINGPISIPDFALQHNTTSRLMHVYNPWILGNRISSGGTYTLKVPR